MSVTTARAEFEKGLGAKAAVSSCSMDYVYMNGRQLQRFTFSVNGDSVVVDVTPSQDINATLNAAAVEYAAKLGGT